MALMLRLAFLVAVVVTAAVGAASAEKGGADSSSGPVPLPRVFVLDGPALATARARAAAGDKEYADAVADLRRDADKALKAGPFSVVDKKETPPSGDKHDYMSVGPYWWPDPSKPDGKPYIRRDGEVNDDRGKFDNVPLGHMAKALAVLGPAWYFTGHEPYAAHAARLLRTWFLDEKTRMNPNLNYGQAIPGVTDGRAAGIIDTVCLIDLVDAVGLLAGSRAWTDADQKALEGWFREYLKWLRESRIGKDEEKTGNNHGTWYDAQAASFALLVGKTDIAAKVLGQTHRRIDSQIEPDGRQPLELARTKSWDYSTMNLRGWCTVALLGEKAGVDLWAYRSADGRSIRKAIDFLLPYAAPGAQWPHKQITKFNPERLLPVLRLAAARYGDTKYAPAAGDLDGGRDPGWREVLLRPARTIDQGGGP